MCIRDSAAGVLITSEPVVNYVPLQTNDDVVTTQFPMGTLEALGLLKMDFLGLRTLNVIMDTIALAIEAGAEPFKSEDMPLDDPGAVSYTHLDVYKRQLFICHKCLRRKGGKAPVFCPL